MNLCQICTLVIFHVGLVSPEVRVSPSGSGTMFFAYFLLTPFPFLPILCFECSLLPQRGPLNYLTKLSEYV